ncbi:MAG: cardiolipin synthase ClsB [Planctomycetes bacterium]|nr:cardiolipin synthase ClsB [Planctomycetota bacterium]
MKDDGSDLCVNPAILRSGNGVRLLRDGAEAYPRMLETIEAARETVFLEMYTFAEDAIGRRFMRALVERAKAGVDVRVMYDALGSRGTSREFFGALRAEGVRVLEFQPLSRGFRGFRFRRRDHRKCLVVDTRVAFVGGLNISREYAAPADGGLGWRDTQIEIEGPIVFELAGMFLELWSRERLKDALPLRPPPEARAGGAPMLMLSSQRFRDRWEIARHYRTAIRRAKERIWIANAYFLPSARFRRALKNAAARGVDVRLLVPGKSDFAPVLYAAQRLFAAYLKWGIRVFEWPGQMMHAKTAVIDGRWSTVGSYNIDHLSLVHNYELTAVVVDAAFGGQMEAMFERDFARCREIRPEGWGKRPWSRRLLEDFFYTFRALF